MDSMGMNVSITSGGSYISGLQWGTSSNAAVILPLLGFLLVPLALSFMMPMVVFQLVLDKTHGQLEMIRMV
jgi:hypothetical protein